MCRPWFLLLIAVTSCGTSSQPSGTATLNLELPSGNVTATAAAFSVSGPVSQPDGAVVGGGAQTIGIFLYDNATARNIVFVISLYPVVSGMPVPTGTIPVVPRGTTTNSLSATMTGGGANALGTPLAATSGSVTITDSSLDSASSPGHIRGTFVGTMPDTFADGGAATISVSGSFDAVSES